MAPEEKQQGKQKLSDDRAGSLPPPDHNYKAGGGFGELGRRVCSERPMLPIL